MKKLTNKLEVIETLTDMLIDLELQHSDYQNDIYLYVDEDGNGTLDILDIITVNKAILGKENLDAERIPYIDFNQNQIPDSDDALTMLKMIVGLT